MLTLFHANTVVAGRKGLSYSSVCMNSFGQFTTPPCCGVQLNFDVKNGSAKRCSGTMGSARNLSTFSTNKTRKRRSVFVHFIGRNNNTMSFIETAVMKQKRYYGTSRRGTPSYYEILGLSMQATPQQIKTSYYRLSKVYHPDINKSAKAAEKFQKISEAYQVLGNAISRREYDRQFAGLPTKIPTFEEDQSMEQLRKTVREQQYRGTGRKIPHKGRTQIFNYDEHLKQHYRRQLNREWEEAAILRQMEKQEMNAQRDSSLVIGLLGFLISIGIFLITVEEKVHPRKSTRKRPKKKQNEMPQEAQPLA